MKFPIDFGGKSQNCYDYQSIFGVIIITNLFDASMSQYAK